MRKTVLTLAAASLAALAGAALEPAAANPWAGNGYGYGYGEAPVSAPAPVDPRQHMLGVWSVETQTGRTVGEYRPDGTVSGVVHLRGRPQPMPFTGRYTVTPLGGDRFALTLSLPGTRPRTDEMRILPDGSLYSVTARFTVYRLR